MEMIFGISEIPKRVVKFLAGNPETVSKIFGRKFRNG